MALGVYVHLPFCPYICPYCDFAKWPHRRSVADRYLQALFAEIERAPRTQAATVFFGGGTPNAYDAEIIASLTGRLCRHFSGGAAELGGGPSTARLRRSVRDDIGPIPNSSIEISVEVNPELVRPGDFKKYRGAGINRVSIGVQSFDSNEIVTLGRKHTVEQVERVVRDARSAGIRAVSLDLMFGVPGQTADTWRTSLDRAIALKVDHISTYGLTVEEGTPYAAWQLREPRAFFDDVREAEFYGIAIDVLEAAGYRQYEISNFAKPGHVCLHNMNYWANGEYIGLGVGAASYLGGVRSTHTRSLEEYLSATLGDAEISSDGVVPGGRPTGMRENIDARGIPSESERLEGSRRVGEAVMLALRTAQGVGVDAFNERYDMDFLQQYARAIGDLEAAGVLERDGGYVRLTKRGRFVANDACAAFIPFE